MEPNFHVNHKPIAIINKTGDAIPNDVHAVSVCLPTWESNIAYEEGRLELNIGYPRFLMNEKVRQLNNGRIIFSNRYFAQFCQKYCDVGFSSIVINRATLFVMAEDTDKVKKFWQHTGLGICSRHAEAILENKVFENNPKDLERVISKIKSFLSVKEDDIYLFSSGMTAIFMAFLITPGPFVMFGFPYLDSLKILEKYGKCTFVTKLEELNDIKDIGTIFMEFPANPLLSMIDLETIQQIATKRKAKVVIDDTLTTFYNADLSKYCDVLVTSLTKSFSGYGNVCAGSLCLSQTSQHYDLLKSKISEMYRSDINWIYAGDLSALALNCADYEFRLLAMQRNSNLFTIFLMDKLKAYPNIVANYYHPEKYNKALWDKYCTGSCHLFSLEFATEDLAQRYYDDLKLNKGPSLGNWCTLVCPYTVLAHYNELEWAASYGVKKHLLRISIGCELNLISIFEKSFEKLLVNN